MSTCQREGHEKKAFTCGLFHSQGDLRFCLRNLAAMALRTDYTGCIHGWLVSAIFCIFSVALKVLGFFNSQCWWKSSWKRTQWDWTRWLTVFISSGKLKQLLLPISSTCTAAPLHAWVCECHSSRVCCDSRASAQVKQKLNWVKSAEPLHPRNFPSDLEKQIEMLFMTDSNFTLRCPVAAAAIKFHAPALGLTGCDLVWSTTAQAWASRQLTRGCCELMLMVTLKPWSDRGFTTLEEH